MQLPPGFKSSGIKATTTVSKAQEIDKSPNDIIFEIQDFTVAAAVVVTIDRIRAEKLQISSN